MNHKKTIVDAILDFPNRTSNPIAVQFKKQEQWVVKSWLEYYQNLSQFGAALLHLGLNKGEKVSIMSNTRYEWSVADAGILASGGVVVPVYTNSTSTEVEYILNHSETKILLIENDLGLRVWNQIRSQCPRVEKVIIIETRSALAEGYVTWNELLDIGSKILETKPNFLTDQARQVSASDAATIVYTSGTTGLPKGVLLTHTQIVSEVSEAFPLCGVSEKDVSLSFLPYAHVLGRVEHWGHQWLGFTMAYAESIDQIRVNLKEIQPTILVAVPRIFEKIYSAIWAQMENQKLKAKAFDWALKAGLAVGELKQTRSQMPLSLLAEFILADRLLLCRVRDAFGGKLKFCISGGAPLSSDVALFFHACGVLILEGYGLTETTAAICVNTPFNYKFGSVGRPIGDVEIKIAEDGEILIKSKKVMKEYYKDPQATSSTLHDGWFATGDIGEILSGGHLKITDRKKDLIKTAGGKYVAPQKLENLLKISPLVSQVLIHGDQKKYIVALITVDRLQVERMAKENSWSFDQWQDLTQKHEVYEAVRRALAETNSKLASFETIKKFLIIPTEFTVEGGELTPSLKIKRKHLDQKYHKEIDSLYE
ncbi:MAG: long-chain fatty acid--CoA ligase [Bdellovibrionota bacterium]